MSGPSGALCIFHQRSWRFPLCIHHHSLGPHIDTSRWHHFGRPWGLVLRGDQEVFDGASTFEVSLDPIPSTDLFDAFTKTLCVGYDYVTLTLNFSGGSRGTVGTLVTNPINGLTGGLVKPFLHFVQSPLGIFTFSESLPEMFSFLFEQLRIAAHCLGPMGEGDNDTKFVVVAIPLYTGLYELASCTQ